MKREKIRDDIFKSVNRIPCDSRYKKKNEMKWSNRQKRYFLLWPKIAKKKKSEEEAQSPVIQMHNEMKPSHQNSFHQLFSIQNHMTDVMRLNIMMVMIFSSVSVN